MTAQAPSATVPSVPQANRILDVRPMNCPLPILRTKAEFAKMQTGEVLKVVYRQHEYVRELELFARQTGNRVLGTVVDGDHHVAWIEKV